MRMRQIQAASMHEAMQRARKELGDDAVMLRTEERAEGVTVTFGVEEPEIQGLEDAAPVRNFTAAGATHATRTAQSPLTSGNNTESLALIARALTWHGLSEAWQSRIMQACQSSAHKGADAESILTDVLRTFIRYAPIRPTHGMRPLMLIGTPGAGKTFAVAKLAADAARQKLPLHVITTDTTRAAAYDQLAAFTGILGVSLAMADSADSLKLALAQHAGTPTIIDTAGCNPYQFEELKALGELAKLRVVEPVLVMPMGIDADEAREIAGVFSFLDSERMLITRTDCARRLSGIFAARDAGDFAFSNASASLRVADGCPDVTAETLSRLMLRPLREREA